jgi:hypothetical protein
VSEATETSGAPQARGSADRYTARLTSLKRARSSYDAHWKDLADFLMPRAPRFSPASDANRAGTKRSEKILRDDAGQALEIGTKGLMSGATPPTRDWFGMATPDPDLNEWHPVKLWLEIVDDRIEWILHKSNSYNSLFGLHEGNFGFGTACMLVEEEPRQVIRTYLSPIGSFYLAAGPGLVIDTLYRECAFRVEQLVRRFGKANCSLSVQSMFNGGNLDAVVPVVHAVQPRLDRSPSKMDRLNMAWTSCYFEQGGGDGGKLLGESGFNEFPAMPARWTVIGEDAYGSNCPGMRALGDIKSLQQLERRALNIAAKMADPSVVVPSELENKPGKVNLLPGGATYVDTTGAGKRVYPVHEIDARALEVIEVKAGQTSERIYRHFFADLFRMISQLEQEGEKATAAEIYAKIEEKAQQLGPVLHRLENETLAPFIDRIFNVGMRRGLFPPPPRELQGMELKVEFKSILHQAQGAGAATGIVNVSAWALQFAEAKPEVLDKIDTDQMVDELARVHGVPASCIVADEKVQEIRQARAQQQQAMQAAEMAKAAQAGSVAAKNLSETDLAQDSALSRLMGEVA